MSSTGEHFFGVLDGFIGHRNVYLHDVAVIVSVQALFPERVHLKVCTFTQQRLRRKDTMPPQRWSTVDAHWALFKLIEQTLLGMGSRCSMASRAFSGKYGSEFPGNQNPVDSDDQHRLFFRSSNTCHDAYRLVFQGSKFFRQLF